MWEKHCFDLAEIKSAISKAVCVLRVSTRYKEPFWTPERPDPVHLPSSQQKKGYCQEQKKCCHKYDLKRTLTPQYVTGRAHGLVRKLLGGKVPVVKQIGFFLLLLYLGLVAKILGNDQLSQQPTNVNAMSLPIVTTWLWSKQLVLVQSQGSDSHPVLSEKNKTVCTTCSTQKETQTQLVNRW